MRRGTPGREIDPRVRRPRCGPSDSQRGGDVTVGKRKMGGCVFSRLSMPSALRADKDPDLEGKRVIYASHSESAFKTVDIGRVHVRDDRA